MAVAFNDYCYYYDVCIVIVFAAIAAADRNARVERRVMAQSLLNHFSISQSYSHLTNTHARTVGIIRFAAI